MNENITKLSAIQLAQKIHSHDLKCLQVAEAFIVNIEKKSSLNAVTHFFPDQVRAEASKLDIEADNGHFRGPLHGVPLVIKDNIHIAGIPNTAGSSVLKNFIPFEDAVSVKKLRDAGALLIAKVNMSEFAFGVTTNNGTFGQCHNSQVFDYSPGGSSGGTGAAVGSYMAPSGLGTDTGSIKLAFLIELNIL
jgi:Asp-tRNA(Asn)/Glu-tRNA(Gln) amidotransferase A subunit family amidase